MMFAKRAAFFVASVIMGSVASCGGTDSNSNPGGGDGGTAQNCAPGSQQSCTCADGKVGKQTCTLDGTGYEPCSGCGTGTGGGTGGGAGGGTTGGGAGGGTGGGAGGGTGGGAGGGTGGGAGGGTGGGGGDAGPDAPPDAPADVSDAGGGFTSIFPGDIAEGETHLAYGSNGFVAAVWTAFNNTSIYIGYSFSKDSGVTWTPVQTLDAPLATQNAAGDQTVAIDSNDNAWMSFITFNNAVTEMHVYAVEAPAGTTTFGTPVEVTDPIEGTPQDGATALFSYDKPWIAITKNNEIIVTYTRFEQSGATNIIGGRSSDGTSFSRVNVTTNGLDGGTGDFVNLAFPCASSSTDRLWVVHMDQDSTGNFGVVLHYSDDDGATWPAANTVVVDPNTASGIFDDPSCAGNGNDAYVQFEHTGAGGTVASSVLVAHSSNGGTSFGAPVNVLDTASAAAWHSEIALEASGKLDVEYYGGASDGDTNASVFFVRSADQGATWSKETLIKNPITLTSQRNPQNWLGDYLGVTTGAGSLYTVYTDNSSGTSRVDFRSALLP
jgi:hypothetical protein